MAPMSSSYQLSILVETLIPVVLGTYFTLLAAGRVGSNSPKMVEWRQRYGGQLRVIGPLVVLLAIARAVWVLFLSPPN